MHLMVITVGAEGVRPNRAIGLAADAKLAAHKAPRHDSPTASADSVSADSGSDGASAEGTELLPSMGAIEETVEKRATVCAGRLGGRCTALLLRYSI